ncbi:YoaK family protein [Silvibacterium acidisoli]|uniref:YoaK family protein n=1 Tax=Acidobacteriaceae bacterium ZG23-2 TaxID=2883246 RepID=UPI00406C12D0
MPIPYLRSLTSPQRTEKSNRDLGWCLAFLAGAANAGGFLVVRQYTSHMTGIVSMMAGNVAVARWSAAANGLAAVASFFGGSLITTLLVRWARHHRLRSQYALPLLLEALLFASVCLTAPIFNGHHILLLVSVMCFGMGLQNAMITKLSGSAIRTTHLTGMVTDIGIACGRLIFAGTGDETVNVERERRVLKLLGSLVFLFFLGGVVGAFGFNYFGLNFMLPVAGVLLLLAVVPVADDLRNPIVEEQTLNS